MHKINLQDSILVRYPQADPTILSELSTLVEKHSIKWINGKGGGATFIVSQLSEAKGLDTKDFANHFAPYYQNLTSHAECDSSEVPLAGQFKLLNGEALANFKKLYQAEIGESLGRINALWVCDFEGAYSYLVQGSTQTAKDFQSLGANAIESAVKKELVEQPEIERVDRRQMNLWGSEETLAMHLTYLAQQGGYNVIPEQSVLDDDQSKCATRRFDLVHLQVHRTKKQIVECYELKKDVIDLCDLITTVEAKAYPELLKRHYKAATEVKMILVAPYGGTPQALAKCQEYDNVEIWTVRKFSQFLLEKVKKRHEKLDPHYVYSILEKTEWCQKLLALPVLPSTTPQKALEASNTKVVNFQKPKLKKKAA